MQTKNHISLLKFRLLILPYLIISFGFIIVYTFCNWLFVIKLELFGIVRENWINLYLPGTLPFILFLIFLSPTLKLLNKKPPKSDLLFVFLLLSWLFTAVPCCIAQNYIETISGKLNNLEHITQIDSFKKTKYYKLNQFYIDRVNLSECSRWEPTGKHRSQMNYHLYLVCPIKDYYKDSGKIKAWLGIHYSEHCNNPGSHYDEKEGMYNLFYKSSMEKFKTNFFMDFSFLERLGNNTDHDFYQTAIQRNPFYDKSKPFIILEPQYGKFENRVSISLSKIITLIIILNSIWTILILFAPFNKRTLITYLQRKPLKKALTP